PRQSVEGRKLIRRGIGECGTLIPGSPLGGCHGGVPLSVILRAASQQPKVSHPTRLKEPPGSDLIIPLALIADHRELPTEYI
ncbi:putative NAD(P)H-dependent D-xylose reductase xyl1, partial [Dissostichus eleginoides]